MKGMKADPEHHENENKVRRDRGIQVTSEGQKEEDQVESQCVTYREGIQLLMHQGSLKAKYIVHYIE